MHHGFAHRGLGRLGERYHGKADGLFAFAQQRLESKMPVFVLFDPKRPNRALLPEVL